MDILLREVILNQLIGSSSHYLKGFINPRCAGFLASRVCGVVLLPSYSDHLGIITIALEVIP